MTKEEREDAINFFKNKLENEVYWKKFNKLAIEALEQEPKTWSLDDAREDFMSDVYDTLDFLPTNNEANIIIGSFDRVTSGIKQEPVLDKITEIIEPLRHLPIGEMSDIEWQILLVINKYKAESEE